MVKRFTIFLLISICAGSVFAAKQKRFYLNSYVSYIQSRSSITVKQRHANSDGSGATFGVNLGYWFTRVMAWELGYQQFPSDNYKLDGTSVAQITNNYQYYVALRRHLFSLGRAFNMSGKVGVVVSHHSFKYQPGYKVLSADPGLEGDYSVASLLFGLNAGFKINRYLMLTGSGGFVMGRDSMPSRLYYGGGLVFAI